MLSAAILVAVKDLKVYFRDRTGVALGFLLPIGLVSVFGFVMQFAFGGDGGGMGRAELWLVDADQTVASEELVKNLREADTLRVKPNVGESKETRTSIENKFAEGKAHHALIIEEGFQNSVADGAMPKLTLLRDPGRDIEDYLVRAGLLQAVMAGHQADLMPAMMGEQMRNMGVSEGQVEFIVQASRTFSAAFEKVFGEEGTTESEGEESAAIDNDGPSEGAQFNFLEMVPVEQIDIAPPDRPQDLSYMLAQSVSGIVVMMLMFGLVACGSTLLEEEKSGTLRRLFLAPKSRSSILIGKYIFTAVMGLIQLTVLFTWGELIFSVGMFSKPLTLVVLSVVLTLAVTSFGILIAAWAKTLKQAEGFSTLIILVMSALGGAWFPVQMFDLPGYAELITKCTLTWWAMNGYQQMLWNQAGFTDWAVLQSILVMLAFTAVASFLAWVLYRRRFLTM